MESKLDLNVYKFKHEIKKEDLYVINPSATTATNLNKSGDIIFESQQTSNPIDICNSFLKYSIEIDITKIKENNVDVENITLENNFVPNLFKSMRLTLGNHETENVDNVGEISSMLNFILLDHSNKRKCELIGWIPDRSNEEKDKDNKGFKKRKALYNLKKTFTGIFPLKQIFGFLESYNRLLYLMMIKLTLNRNTDHKKIFYGTKGEGKLTLKSLEWCMPELTLNPESELNLLERLNTDKPVQVNYLNRLTNTIDIPEGSTYTWQIGLMKNRPRYIIIGFKDPDISYTKNNSKFIQNIGDHKMKSLRIKLNNTNYPMNTMVFDHSIMDQWEPYYNYVNLCEEYKNSAQLNILDFLNLYSIFCFDVSAQDEKLIVNGCNVTVEIEKDSALKCKAYCCILEEKSVEILIKSGKMFSIQE